MIITDRYTSPEADHRRELMLAGMEARYIVQGGLLYTDAELLDCRVQQVLREGPLLDLEPAEVIRLAVALMYGYAAANPVASEQDLAYAAEVAERQQVARLRRGLRRIGMAYSDWRRHVVETAERLRALLASGTVHVQPDWTLA